jgi:fused signal recognition particle receptor
MTPKSPPSLVSRLRAGLRRTAESLLGDLAKNGVDEAVLEELETRLIAADIGVEASQRIIERLRSRAKNIPDAEALRATLVTELVRLLEPVATPLTLPAGIKPFVLLALGVNGVGKTTTLGKLALHFKYQGKNVMLAAGDTFRAAAVEQLQKWGERHGVPVITQGQGADPAAVAHDAYAAAKARDVDVLLVDTAGRLHTHGVLMEELKKIRRVLAKLDPAAPHECLLVLDAGTGQNALHQIAEFNAAVGVTGLVAAKLDGTAKGGILVAAAERFRIPIRFLGVGEAGEDLLEFEPRAFAEALVGTE